jgi:hypothetical protein
MNKDNRYEIIIEALCQYAEGLEQKLIDQNAKQPTKWLPVAIDEMSPNLAQALKRHNVTPPKRSPGRPRKHPAKPGVKTSTRKV